MTRRSLAIYVDALHQAGFSLLVIDAFVRAASEA